MAAFEYKAINDTGKIVLGRIEANNDSDLEMRLGRMGLEMIRCWPARQGGWSGRGGKVGRQELITFCFHLEQLTRAGVPILPVACTGQEKVLPALRRLRRATIHVAIGTPFYPPQVEGKATSADIQAFTDEIMYCLAAMLPPEYRGVYSDVPDQRPDLLAFYAAGH